MWIVEKIVSKGKYNYAVVKNHPNATKKGSLKKLLFDNPF